MTAAELVRNRSAISATASTLVGFAMRVASSLLTGDRGYTRPERRRTPRRGGTGRESANARNDPRSPAPAARASRTFASVEGPAVFGRTWSRLRDRVSGFQITLHDGVRGGK